MPQLRHLRLPPRGRPRLAGPAPRAPRPPRRLPAYRPHAQRHGRRPVAPPVGPPRIGPPPRHRQRPTRRPRRRRRRRGRPRPGRPPGPGRAETVPPRPYLTVWATDLDAPRRRMRPGPHRGRLAPPRRRARHLPLPPSFGDHPPSRLRPPQHPPYRRHRRPGRRVPLHHRPPATAPVVLYGTATTGTAVGADRLLGPLRPGQPQQRDPGPLRRRQKLPGQTRSPPLPLPRRRNLRRRPRRRIPPPRQRGRRHLPPPRQPSVRLNPFDLAPGPDPLTRRALFIHTLVTVLLGHKPSPEETGRPGPAPSSPPTATPGSPPTFALTPDPPPPSPTWTANSAPDADPAGLALWPPASPRT